MKNKDLGYDEAIKRIQEIVEVLEKGEKGMDELANLVKEASELMKYCRVKLRNTEQEIHQALNDDTQV